MDTPGFRPTPIPRGPRRRRCAHLVLTGSADREIAVMVRDSSARGFSAAALGKAPGVDDGRELWGLVRWSKGQLFGVEFDMRLTPPS